MQRGDLKLLLKRKLLRLLMEISDAQVLGPVAVRMAGRLAGPYKDRWILASLSQRPYISPSSQIKGVNVSIGPSAFIDDFVTVYAHRESSSISVGAGTKIYRCTVVEAGDGGSICIGEDTHIQASCDLKGFVKNLIIGSQVTIAPHCCFSSYNHQFDDATTPIPTQGLTSRGNTVVEDDVWLGAGVIVLDGVKIGRGAVVGAGSVVTRDLPAYSICVGVPARVVKWREGREIISVVENLG